MFAHRWRLINERSENSRLLKNSAEDKGQSFLLWRYVTACDIPGCVFRKWYNI